MEYPPRKHHRLRREPTIPDGAVACESARRKGMMRELKGLGTPIYKHAEHERDLANYELLEGDLLEKYPSRANQDKRKQNMVHFDIDPPNIFIGGLELDRAGRGLWRNTRSEAKAKANGASTEPDKSTEKATDKATEKATDKATDKAPEKTTKGAVKDTAEKDGASSKDKGGKTNPLRVIHGQQNRNPTEEMGAFACSSTQECIRQAKRNVYYLNRRWKAKHGFHAPKEQFGPEWDKIPDRPHGPELVESNIAANYRSHTNVWGIAWTMWILITKYYPPTPPQPQPPYDLPVADPRLTDEAIELSGRSHVISYCPFFLDPANTDYDYVDIRLRQTISQCMSHDPGWRPSLKHLEYQATQIVRNAAFLGETDEYVRRWVHYWLYEAPSTSGPGGPTGTSGKAKGFGGGGGGAPVNKLEENLASKKDPDHPIRIQLQIQYNASFPYGHDRIPNAAVNLDCGFRALVDSIQAQIGPNPLIGGVPTAIVLPRNGDLRTIYNNPKAAGEFDVLVLLNEANEDEESNYFLSELSLVLVRWGESVGLSLQLCYILEGRGRPMREPVEDQNPRNLWIYNDNAMDLAGASYNHYEGIRARPRPASPAGGAGTGVKEGADPDDLPDYESD
ncbi:Uu.00g131040.m01.CDS01 [Anthostomella pinea]|uniref:Uu.00g131040.m01.CDS01 n=1 Tax=Anthostomella pinea TaxID=933095 RepID=A0AAI8VJR6_9PEZI|nr:Uu.00g131040.m01.CDS01 [Anthostomella pinea]